MRISRPISIAVFAMVAVLGVGGCGSGGLGGSGDELSGIYTSGDSAFLGSYMEFQPGNKVQWTSLGGIFEVPYKVEGKQLKMTPPGGAMGAATTGGATVVFNINDQGCLDSGGMLGTFCRAEKLDLSKGLSGVYSGAGVKYEFRPGGRLLVTPLVSQPAEGLYVVNGQSVAVSGVKGRKDVTLTVNKLGCLDVSGGSPICPERPKK